MEKIPLSRRQWLLATSGMLLPNIVTAKSTSVASITTSDLVEYPHLRKPIQTLLSNSLALTRKKLSYQYGSCDPANGGMDCSGTVYHTLRSVGIQPPRSSHTIYLWAKKAGTIKRVANVHRVDDPKLNGMKPGDLMFWEGTYDVGERNPPISHVMIYLGTSKKDGKGVVFGASSGRRYRGQKIHGVSVFDLRMPSAESSSKFVAYGRIPGLGKG